MVAYRAISCSSGLLQVDHVTRSPTVELNADRAAATAALLHLRASSVGHAKVLVVPGEGGEGKVTTARERDLKVAASVHHQLHAARLPPRKSRGGKVIEGLGCANTRVMNVSWA